MQTLRRRCGTHPGPAATAVLTCLSLCESRIRFKGWQDGLATLRRQWPGRLTKWRVRAIQTALLRRHLRAGVAAGESLLASAAWTNSGPLNSRSRFCGSSSPGVVFASVLARCPETHTTPVPLLLELAASAMQCMVPVSALWQLRLRSRRSRPCSRIVQSDRRICLLCVYVCTPSDRAAVRRQLTHA